MKKPVFLIAICLLFAAACAPKEGIEVRDAWARAAVQGGNSAVYFTLHNYSAADDSLLGISSEIAESVEMHESTMVNDVMEMNMLESVSLPSGKTVEFTPGGLHIMLVNLRQDLKIGGTIEITLHFQNGADLPLSVHIQAGPEHDDD